MSTSSGDRPAERGPAGVFLSYSRNDSSIATFYRLLLRASGIRVWQDRVSIEPGEVWRLAIARGIQECDRMLVLWCRHSSDSEHVEHEYRLAIAHEKTVVPIRLDHTRLPAMLIQFQAEDLSGFTWWSHELLKFSRLAWVMGLVSLGLAWWFGARP